MAIRLKKGVQLPLLLCMAAPLVLLSACSSSSSSDTDVVTDSDESDDSDGDYTYSSDCFANTDQTELMVCLANNLLSTLDTEEAESMVYELTEENATDYWSNLPLQGPVTRNGISLEDMSTDAKDAAEVLVDAALSIQGQETMDGIRAADSYLGENGNSVVYGEDKYALAFLGTPSTTEPWIAEFSGHHYTFFASFNGSPVGATPYFVAVEPVSWVEDGVTYDPMAPHKESFVAMFESLGATELTAAQLSEAYDDVLVGPQQDGDYPETSEGLAVSTLSDSQRALVAAVIDAYAGDANETGQSAAYTTDESLDETYIAWSSYSDLETQGSYARIDGPGVWIEFTVQPGVVLSDPHYHSIWRDKELDYGGNFDF